MGRALHRRAGARKGNLQTSFAMDEEKHGVRSWRKESLDVSQPEADVILENRCKCAGIPEGVFPWSTAVLHEDRQSLWCC